MSRLLVAPAVAAGLFAAGLAIGWWNGLLYPAATTFARCFLPETPETEADLVG